ncbi:outer membrane autotransporter barrel protein [Anaerovibrio sp. JC8]|uniref:autotransporter outer membrane beta-barrel domain-containing protein n=1 Tax=Anaerovibrio sp. JC8 TaxID=1240085 RepID=UPI000A0CBEC1|nr:autotransporter outer membrane beta-barrel domain-containing protein [Anaerovibrio sp. JC8]ORT98972.1 outer membrane autotransporter barrel protein [Anaerovibrio sp. JC8]
METRKYGSPLGENISSRKGVWKGKKAQMALALAVSLWIGGMGSVEVAHADADEFGIYLDDEMAGAPLTVLNASNDEEQYIRNDAAVTQAKTGTGAELIEKSGKALTIAGGNWRDYSGIMGGVRSTTAGDITGYTLNLSNLKFEGNFGLYQGEIVGAYALEDGDVYKNTVILDGVTVKDSPVALYGGHVDSDADTGNAHHNTVSIKNSNLWSAVAGGYTAANDDNGIGTGSANDNEVTIENSNVQTMVLEIGGVCGGAIDSDDGKTAINNTVNLKNALIGGPVWGGMNLQIDGSSVDLVTGNTLNLAGANKIGEFDYQLYIDNAKNSDDPEVAAIAAMTPAQIKEVIESWSPEMSMITEGRVQNFEKINLLEGTWGTPVLTLSGANGIMKNMDGTKAVIDASKLKFTNPEDVQNGATMNLIHCEDEASLTATLDNTAMDEQKYNVNPLAGIAVDAAVKGSFALTEKNLTYTASNQANKLTFTDVEWKDSGALLNHKTTLSNVSFDGAAVDTSNIKFTNIEELAANKKMTLVSDFGNSVGTITGTKYKVGSTLEGDGKASLVGKDLIFTAETGTAQPQTHNTVMGATASMAALSAGNDFVGTATDGLSMGSNTGTDGLATFANMGGGSITQETGSHVTSHTWNAILALGHQNVKKSGTTEYGAFFEYGTGNYSTFDGDVRGDGSMHYTGGGLLGKWTSPRKDYIEGSIRLGSIKDDASNVLTDGTNTYGYNTSAGYYGFHLGYGKLFDYSGGRSLDVYGKFFYNHRNGVSFDAGGHYDLDAINSQILRLGTRYSMQTSDQWKWYGGLAYEYEFGGRATGTADGVAIRGAETKGSSLRAELGATITQPNSPWTVDLNLTAFAGKKRGVSGGVGLKYNF